MATAEDNIHLVLNPEIEFQLSDHVSLIGRLRQATCKDSASTRREPDGEAAVSVGRYDGPITAKLHVLPTHLVAPFVTVRVQTGLPLQAVLHAATIWITSAEHSPSTWAPTIRRSSVSTISLQNPLSATLQPPSAAPGSPRGSCRFRRQMEYESEYGLVVAGTLDTSPNLTTS
jgi:hypothetical protein